MFGPEFFYSRAILEKYVRHFLTCWCVIESHVLTVSFVAFLCFQASGVRMNADDCNGRSYMSGIGKFY